MQLENLIGKCKEKDAGGGCSAGEGVGGGAERQQAQVYIFYCTLSQSPNVNLVATSFTTLSQSPNVNVVSKSFTPSLMASRWAVELGAWQLEDDASVQAFLPPTLD